MPYAVIGCIDSPLLLETPTPHQRECHGFHRKYTYSFITMASKVSSIYCNESLDEKGICTLFGFYCRIFAFGIWLRFDLTACVHAKSVPTISTFGLFIGILTILLECSFMFVHLNCFISLGKIFDNYLFRIVFYSVSSTVGVICTTKRKRTNSFTIFIFLGIDSVMFIYAHCQRKSIEQYRDSGSFGTGSSNSAVV